MIMIGSRFERIAIIGSAGVGKTTLLDAFFTSSLQGADTASWQSELAKIPEQVRVLCEERGYKSPYDIPAEDIHKFREEVLDRQISAEDFAKSFIVDRSSIDAWVYYMRWSWNSTSVEDAERFYNKAYKQAQSYDLLIYLPIMFEIEDDGFRWNNPIYQRQIDRLLISTVRDWGLEDSLVSIESSALEERVMQMQNFL
jgi:nicotinamide riboside kinase